MSTTTKHPAYDAALAALVARPDHWQEVVNKATRHGQPDWHGFQQVEAFLELELFGPGFWLSADNTNERSLAVRAAVRAFFA